MAYKALAQAGAFEIWGEGKNARTGFSSADTGQLHLTPSLKAQE